MSFWKVAGGIGAGVGAVVLLPVAGPVLAVTAVGAAVAGAVGGAAGVALTVADKKKLEEEQRLARQKAQAAKKKREETQAKAAKAKRELNRLKKENRDKEATRKAEEDVRKADENARKAKEEEKKVLEDLAIRSFDFIKESEDPLSTFIMCCKLQIAMANADGEISEGEKRDVDEFLSELGKTDDEDEIRGQIRAILDKPPTVEDLLGEIKVSKSPPDILQGYLEVLVTTMRADGVIHRDELDFIDRFVKEFDSIQYPLNLPYKCLQLPIKKENDEAVIALCLEPTDGRFEVWINDEWRNIDKPLPNLSLETFKMLFDSDALNELDDMGVCNAADHVRFLICGGDDVYEYAKKVILAGGDRYSIARCPCSEGNKLA